MRQITVGQSTELNLYGPDTPTGEKGARMLHVVIHHHGTHIGLLFTGHAGLNRALPIDEARTYLSDIKRAATAGTAVWAIEEQAGAWTSAAAVVDQVEQSLIDGIREALKPAPQPVDVSDIVDGMPAGGGWNAYRQQATTRAAVTSDAMDRVLDGAVGGYIPRSKQATSVQLIALSKRGLVELRYGRRGNQRVIVGARITGKGAKHTAAA
jgi:hypothetical protein